jgi:hypothetical protein
MQASELQFLKKKQMVHRLPWHYCASTNRATSEYPTSKNKNHVIVPLLFVLLCINDPEQQEESYFSGKKKYKKKNHLPTTVESRGESQCMIREGQHENNDFRQTLEPGLLDRRP